MIAVTFRCFYLRGFILLVEMKYPIQSRSQLTEWFHERKICGIGLPPATIFVQKPVDESIRGPSTHKTKRNPFFGSIGYSSWTSPNTKHRTQKKIGACSELAVHYMNNVPLHRVYSMLSPRLIRLFRVCCQACRKICNAFDRISNKWTKYRIILDGWGVHVGLLHACHSTW